MNIKQEKDVRVLTGIVKRDLPAAVREAGPGAVIYSPSLHYARLVGVRLGSPDQDTDPGGGGAKNMQDGQRSVQ